LAYETAKKELKQFQNHALSQRMNERAKHREEAIIRAQSFGKQVLFFLK
jgi:hypothetical protein